MATDVTRATMDDEDQIEIEADERPRRMRGRPELLLTPLSFLLLLAVWEWAVQHYAINSILLPPPSKIWRSLAEGVTSGLYLKHFLVTVSEAALGFAIAAVSGVIIGTLVTQFWLLERTVYPYLIALQSMPKIAIAPLIVIWFGYGGLSKVVIAAMISFFPILVNVVVGLRTCDASKIDLVRSLSGSPWQVFWYVKLPNALPFMFAGFNIAIIFCILGAIVGEFVGGEAGLGFLIVAANTTLDVAQVFAVLVVLATLGVTVFLALQLVHRTVVFWAESDDINRYS
jgi:NitT/TauT family transport system permease protein